MSIQYTNRSSGVSCACPDKFGCPAGVCPDFTIRRHDTKPPFRLQIADCGEPLDLANRVLEVNMWAKARLKLAITADDETISFADGIGFEQVMAGDTIIMDRVRNPEHMLVNSYDEDLKTITVTRGWNGTTASIWKKGARLRIFRILNAAAETEMVFEDVEDVDGTITRDVLTSSYFVYEWKPGDTCLPGCYYMEFKLLKMRDLSYYLPGGHWDGLFHRDSANNYMTGSVYSDSSVVLSMKVIPTTQPQYADEDDTSIRFLLPSGDLWQGATHLHEDGSYYTGSVHDDGSVYLSNTGIAFDESVAYNSDGPVSVTPLLEYDTFSTTSVNEVSTTSFTQCQLGSGVEWARRYPMAGDGFLVKVEDSPTMEI